MWRARGRSGFPIAHVELDLREIDLRREVRKQPNRLDLEEVVTLLELARPQGNIILQVWAECDGVNARVAAVGGIVRVGFERLAIQACLKLLRAGHVLDLEAQCNGTRSLVIFKAPERCFQRGLAATVKTGQGRGVVPIAGVAIEVEEEALVLAAQRLRPADL